MIDDGSRDNSAAILNEISAADSRFRYIYQENQGVSAARNHGLAISKGRYITFIDADDILPENYLEMLMKALTNDDCQMSVCDVTVIENEKETMRFSCETNKLDQRETLNLIISRREINSGPCAKLFRREVLNDLKFPPLKAYEDILFAIAAVCKCEHIAVTNKTEYRYIQNVGSAMSTFLKIPSQDIVTATEQMLAFLKDRKDLSPLCFYTTASHLMQYVLPLLNSDDEKARGFVNAARCVYKQYVREIWSCSAFPWKEKITFTLFAYGWIYQNKRIKRLR